MKTRITQSFKWREDIILPLSKELEISPEDFEEILHSKLDMSSLESLHYSFEHSKYKIIESKLSNDLNLYCFNNILHIINDEEENKIVKSALSKIKNNISYEDALKEAKMDLVQELKK